MLATVSKPAHLQSQQPHFGALLPLTPFQWRERQKEVLFSTDLDHTLLGWLSDNDDKLDEAALNGTAQVINKHRKDMAVHFNTGRGLTATKEIAPFLKGVPVDYLSVNNGQELYINRRRKEASKWIASLDPSDEVRLTRRIARKHQWNTERAMALLKGILQREGFTPDEAPNTNLQYAGVTRLAKTIHGEKLLIEFYPDQTSLYVEPSLAVNGKPYGEHILKQWKAALQQEGLHAEFSELYAGEHPGEGNAHHAIYMAFSNGVNKASVVDGLIGKRLPNLKGVVTAGDSASNDYDFVAPHSYGKLPNFPIISGLTSRLIEKLKGHPHMTVTETGQLGPALAQQVERVLDTRA